MGSDLAAGGAGWAASALGGLSLGAAAALVLDLLVARGSERKARRRRDLSLVFLCLAWAVLCAAVLLIVPPKALLSDRTLWIWAGSWCVLGCLAAVFPGPIGIPLAVLALSLLGLTAAEASAWHALSPGREIARLVPYQADASGAAGDLAVPDRNAVPVLSRVALAGRECSLEARVLDLAGPLGYLFGPRRYKLSRLLDAESSELMTFPLKRGPLTILIGGKDLRLPWISLRTVRSPVLPLEALRPLSWSFDADARLRVLSP